MTATSDGTTYRYDANGNMTQKTTGRGQWTYVYDTDNRLIAVGYAPNGKAYKTIGNYAYDAKGARYQKIVYRYADTDYNNSDTWSLLVEQIGSPTIPAGGSITSTTTYAGSYYEAEDGRFTKRVFLGGTMVASMTAGQVSYFHNDHLGSVNVISDSTGAKRSLTEYDPFGKVSRFERSTPKVQTGWEGFNGKRFDDETGLLFYGGRYYDPKLGRFMTADKIVPYASDPQSLNRYSYVRNNPINLIDPTGHKWSWKKFWHAAVGAIVGVAAGILLGPAGFAVVGSTMAGVIGGALGGAITGGLEGGWRGALMGGLMGGALGGLGGYAIGLKNLTGNLMLGGMAVLGIANTALTGSWDSFTGGLTGAIAGGMIGNGIAQLAKSSKSFSQFDSAHPRSRTDGRPQNALITDKGKGVSGNEWVDDPKVRGKMLDALNQQMQDGKERSGSLVWTENGARSVKMFASGDNMNVGVPSYEPGFSGAFHTHDTLLRPSEMDFNWVKQFPLRDGYNFVVDPKGIIIYSSDYQEFANQFHGQMYGGSWQRIWTWSGS